MIFVVNNN